MGFGGKFTHNRAKKKMSMETDDLAIIISTMSEQSKYITLSLFIFSLKQILFFFSSLET